MSPILGVFLDLGNCKGVSSTSLHDFLDLLFDLVVQGILGREVVLSPMMSCLFDHAGHRYRSKSRVYT